MKSKTINCDILFITTRDLCSELGEAQLIIRRDAALAENGIHTKYWVLRRSVHDHEPLDYFRDRIVAYHRAPHLLGVKKLSKHWLSEIHAFVEEHKPRVIVISGAWILRYGGFLDGLQSLGLPLVYDFHGALEELYEGSRWATRLLRRAVFRYFKKREYETIKQCDAVIGVSDRVMDYINDHYGLNCTFIKVPCGVDKVYSIDEIEFNRSTWRKKLGIPDNAVGFVYGGGVSPWQRVGDVIEEWRKNISQLNLSSPLVCFLFCPDRKRINDVYGLETDPHLRVMQLESSQFQEALCAFDYGFLLRHDTWTNRVAHPNKLSEYLNAGLRVVTDGYNGINDERFKSSCMVKDIKDIYELKELGDRVTRYRDDWHYSRRLIGTFVYPRSIEQLTNYVRQ